MKILFALTVILFLTSCDSKTNNSYEEIVLQEKVSILEKRVDSLINLLNKTNTTTIQSKKGKKAGKDISIPLKGYAQNSPVLAEPLERSEPNNQQIETEKSTSYKTSASSQPVYSSQCMAITKKGTRCLRAARSGGYCWQHGG